MLGGHQCLCWLFCAGLILQKAPGAPCCAVGTWGQSAPFTFHVTCAQKLCLEEAGAHLVASRASQHARFYYKDFSKFIKMRLF